MFAEGARPASTGRRDARSAGRGASRASAARDRVAAGGAPAPVRLAARPLDAEEAAHAGGAAQATGRRGRGRRRQATRSSRRRRPSCSPWPRPTTSWPGCPAALCGLALLLAPLLVKDALGSTRTIALAFPSRGRSHAGPGRARYRRVRRRRSWHCRSRPPASWLDTAGRKDAEACTWLGRGRQRERWEPRSRPGPGALEPRAARRCGGARAAAVEALTSRRA